MYKLFFLCVLISVSKYVSAQSAPQLGKNTNSEVISAMKLEDKARILVGMGRQMPGGAPPTNAAKPKKDSAATQGPIVGSMMGKVLGAAGSTADFTNLGIPSIIVADGPAGLRIEPKRPNETRTYYATAFPIGTLLASTWDVDLVQKAGEAMGNEVKEYGVDILLGPGMNIHRNPLGGRNFEYYSEDPLVTGKIASAMVRGIQSNGVGVSIKHFAVNNFETNRNLVNVKVSPRTLREIYLRGFEIAVKESNPWTVMSSYNKINGIYTSQNGELLTKILRDDWKFKGFVMTDWSGGDNGVEQMKAGNDLIMPGSAVRLKEIIEAVKAGTLDETFLNNNVNNLLNIVKMTPSFQGYKYSNAPDLKAHGVVARNIAAEGIILLKNDAKTLPLKKNTKIAAFGTTAYDLISGGTGSGDVNKAYTISMIEGLQNAGFSLDESVKTTYNTYIAGEKGKQTRKRFFEPANQVLEMTMAKENVDATTSSDYALISIGRISGEFRDRKLDPDFNLTETEKLLIQNVSTAFHAKGKKVIAILNIGGPIETASWSSSVDAIVLPWLPGQEAGNAITDVLIGNVNPSGKLATTFAAKYDNEPTANNMSGVEFGDSISIGFAKARRAEIEYTEGVYIGYRGFDKKEIKPAFEFGYGLSYTDFSFSDLKLSASIFSGKLTATVTIKNIGTVAGKEVVQLYLSAPAKTMDKPTQELKGFAKTKLLAPNATQTINFDINPRDLASFDEKSSSWIAEAGTYEVRIGASSRKIRVNATFKLPTALTVETVSRAFEMKQ